MDVLILSIAGVLTPKQMKVPVAHLQVLADFYNPPGAALLTMAPMTPDFMIYTGQTIQVRGLAGNCVELQFDRAGSVNKLDRMAIEELADALEATRNQPGLRGVLITSAKQSFVVGADITEFPRIFAAPEQERVSIFERANEVINGLEDLPVPTVAAINGYALGGGLELALATDLRVIARTAKIGLPEVKLGIFPGFGGTVRLPRVAGVEVAVDWITSGASRSAEEALRSAVVDAVAVDEELRTTALEMLESAAAGNIDWRARRALKRDPIEQSDRYASWFESVIRTLQSRPDASDEPAAVAAVQLMSRSIGLSRQAALSLETAAFVRIAQTQAAAALVQRFLTEQAQKREARIWLRRS